MNRYLIVAVTLLLTVSACKEDFDLTADYKEVPVVYGLLNQQDAWHYIRVQKGYLLDGDARIAASQPDSIYYADSLVVKLKPLPNGSDITLTLVDGNSIGLPKEGDFFANSPNYLYRTNALLDANKTYRLEVTNVNSGKVITAETGLIKDFDIINLYRGIRFPLFAAIPPLFIWSAAQGAGIYDIDMRFHYKEFLEGTGTLLRDTFVDIPVIRSKNAGANPMEQEISRTSIFSYMIQRIGVNPNVDRQFDATKGIHVQFRAGGSYLASYINSQIAQSGFTQNEALPAYTNLSDGLGIFSCRYNKTMDSVLLSIESLDELACNPAVKSLRFKDSGGNVCP